jgi:hypothetical protein
MGCSASVQPSGRAVVLEEAKQARATSVVPVRSPRIPELPPPLQPGVADWVVVLDMDDTLLTSGFEFEHDLVVTRTQDIGDSCLPHLHYFTLQCGEGGWRSVVRPGVFAWMSRIVAARALNLQHSSSAASAASASAPTSASASASATPCVWFAIATLNQSIVTSQFFEVFEVRSLSLSLSLSLSPSAGHSPAACGGAAHGVACRLQHSEDARRSVRVPAQTLGAASGQIH